MDGELILVPDDELEDTDALTCLGCGFEQEVPIEWEFGGMKNIQCSSCWLEDRWDDKEVAKAIAATQVRSEEKPPPPKKGQLSLFDKN